MDNDNKRLVTTYYNNVFIKGITLVALVVTIIVLLILAGITITVLFNEDGILNKANIAKIETRAATVEEEKNMWFTEVRLANALKTSAKTMDEKLEELLQQGFLTEEEVNQIKTSENNEVTIGSRTISFKIDYITEENPSTDKEGPIVTLEVNNITETSAVLTVNATDEESGLAEQDTYKYYLGEELIESSTTNSYMYKNLTGGESYLLKVEVTDAVGNITIETTTVTTLKPDVFVTELKAGDYVTYVDSEGTSRDSIVLYDQTSNYGIQIITKNVVEFINSTSEGNVTEAISEYNQGIGIFNMRADYYKNSDYSTMGRCVGTVPDNPSHEASTYFNSTDSFCAPFNNKVLNDDTNYVQDWEQLVNLGEQKSDYEYWLGSRLTEYTPTICVYFRYRSVDEEGNLDTALWLYEDYLPPLGATAWTPSLGLRPVFSLKPTVKITGGKGTSESPYTLGI